MATEAQARTTGLPHAVFLQRVTDEPATSPEVRLGQGAFLTLRFVDLLSPDRDPPTSDVFRYQWAATERYCAELAGEACGTEAAHLAGIVRATGEAHRTSNFRLLAAALLAYALYREQDGSLLEAEDTLETLISVCDGRMSHADAVAGWLRLGRVRRVQADFDRAAAAYTEAGQLASAANDYKSVLLSRIGLCNVTHYRGNLAGAETAWRAVLSDAEFSGFRDVHAQAEHGLGNILQRRGQAHEGAPHLWRAYELYEDESTQLRALNDLGLMLLSLGDVEAAERALSEVVKRERAPDNLANAQIELMHCASYRRDRVSFERWRECALSHFDEPPPNIAADFYLKVGIGLARFGNHTRADVALRHGLEVAKAHGLHEFVFRIERIRGGLRDCQALELESLIPEPAASTPALREVSASLAALSA